MPETIVLEVEFWVQNGLHKTHHAIVGVPADTPVDDMEEVLASALNVQPSDITYWAEVRRDAARYEVQNV